MEFSLFLVLFIAYFTSYITAEDKAPVALPIKGGNLAHKNQFKYQVSLQRNDVHFCGGGIIADKFVLTAAHCVINKNNLKFNEGQITVVAGVLNVQHEIGSEAEVKAIYVPKIYDRLETIVGDIAVLKLKNGLGLNRNEYLLRPNKVRGNYRSYANVTAIVAGYGRNNNTVTWNDDGTDFNTGFSDGKLRFAEADIMSNAQCKDQFHFVNITRANICAKVHQSSSDVSDGICFGDSGGPLVFDSNIVVGVASAGQLDCNERWEPAIYTRVSYFDAFINDVLKGQISSNITRVATWEEPSGYFSWFDKAKFVEH